MLDKTPGLVIERENAWSRATGVPQEVIAAIDAVTSYPTEAANTGSWQSPEAAMGADVWNGWVHLSRFPSPQTVVFPSGLLDIVCGELLRRGLIPRMVDRRIRDEPGVPERSALPLRDYQLRAVDALLEAGQGVLDSPPRSGKTRMMLEALRRVALPTLYVVPTRNIAAQTVAASLEFFGKNWAVFVAGVSAVEEAGAAVVVVCTVATALRLPESFLATRRVVVFDEAQHNASQSIRTISNRLPHVYWRFAMSGTFFRSGNDDLAMLGVLSRVVFRITPEELVAMGYLTPGSVLFLPVDTTRVPSSPGKPFQSGCGGSGIFRNEYRNQLAAWVAATLWSRGKRTVVLVGTKEQGWAITRRLEEMLPREPGSAFMPVEFVSTDRPSQVCQDVIGAFVSGNGVRVLVGTSMIGEGTDLPVSDALVYAQGGKAEVGHTQASYRVITAVPGKKRAVIVDFADRHNPTLESHSQERLKTYVGVPIFRTEVLQSVPEFPAWLDRHDAAP